MCGYLLQIQTVKWQDHMNWQRKVNEARASAAALKASINGMSSERKPPDSKWKTFFRRSPLEDAGAVVKNNIYDKGILHNVWEVISPPSTRRSFLRTKSKSSWERCKKLYSHCVINAVGIPVVSWLILEFRFVIFLCKPQWEDMLAVALYLIIYCLYWKFVGVIITG